MYFYVHWRPACMYVCVWCLGSCELPSGSWELNQGPQEEQPMLLNHQAISPAPQIQLLCILHFNDFQAWKQDVYRDPYMLMEELCE